MIRVPLSFITPPNITPYLIFFLKDACHRNLLEIECYKKAIYNLTMLIHNFLIFQPSIVRIFRYSGYWNTRLDYEDELFSHLRPTLIRIDINMFFSIPKSRILKV